MHGAMIKKKSYMSFARGRDAQGGRKVRRNSNRDVKLNFVTLFIH